MVQYVPKGVRRLCLMRSIPAGSNKGTTAHFEQSPQCPLSPTSNRLLAFEHVLYVCEHVSKSHTTNNVVLSSLAEQEWTCAPRLEVSCFDGRVREEHQAL
jgi:hypothetical protein